LIAISWLKDVPEKTIPIRTIQCKIGILLTEDLIFIKVNTP